jgi:MarR family transcriptional regulator, lower aerobic nicotinate degradation pathway regulator
MNSPAERPDRLTSSTLYLLSITGRAAHHRATEAAGRLGLRLGHVAALACLAEFGPRSQRELARLLRQHPSDVVDLLDDLECEALVERERDPADRRRHRVTVTARGRKRLSATMDAVDAEEQQLLARLTPRQRAGLQKCLAAVLSDADLRHGASSASGR